MHSYKISIKTFHSLDNSTHFSSIHLFFIIKMNIKASIRTNFNISGLQVIVLLGEGEEVIKILQSPKNQTIYVRMVRNDPQNTN